MSRLSGYKLKKWLEKFTDEELSQMPVLLQASDHCYNFSEVSIGSALYERDLDRFREPAPEEEKLAQEMILIQVW